MAKKRVFELAAEFGVASQVLLAKLRDMGEFVRSASSPVERPVERKLRALMVDSGLHEPSPDLTAEASVMGRHLPSVDSGDPEVESSRHGRTLGPIEVDYVLEDRFDLLREPIRGSVGSTVRKAKDKTNDSFVAVKFVQSRTGSLTKRLFDREMRSLERLRHPNIVRPITRGVERETEALFIVLDWCELSLADDLDKGKKFGWDELLQKIAIPLCDALAYAHLRQVEHRDIKPANILLRADGSPVLADFGISKLRDDPSTEETVRQFRSGIYAPPELNDPVPYVRDVYSLGVVLLRAMSGVPITDYADLQASVDSAPVPPDVRNLLSKCVNLDPSLRPANGSVLYQALLSLSPQAGSEAQARANYAWLHLTRRAKDSLQELDATPVPRSPELIAQEDLSGDVFAEFVLNSETGLPHRSKIDVIGSRFRFSLALDQTQSRLDVVFVAQPSIEELERRRSRSLALARAFTWSCSRPSSEERAIGGRAALVARLDAFHEAAHDLKSSRVADSTEDLLFDHWTRLLDAREDVERGKGAPMPYTLDGQSGRDATFLLSVQPDDDLVGAQLDVIADDGKHRGTGEVVDQSGDRISLRSPRNFRSLPRRGSLAISLGPTQKALQRQRDAIAAVRHGTAIRPELRDILVDPETATPPVPVQVQRWQRELDEDKKDAVRKALGTKDVLMVQGPPGTGKTSFIAELVWQKLGENPDARILLVSQTHVAVDNALERLEDAGVTNLVRLGRVDEGNIAASTQHLALDRQMSDWANELRTRATLHMEKSAKASGFSPRYLDAALRLEELAALLRQTEQIEAQLSSTQGQGESDLATALGGVDDAVALQDRVDRNAERQQEILNAIQVRLEGDLTLDLRSTAADARAAVSLLVGDSADARHLMTLMEIQADWLQRVASQAEMAFAFMRTRRVVAGTNLGFLGHPAARNLEFDLCILDEASKATATETLVPLARSSQWVLVGDTRQLPPMDEEVLRHRSLMESYELTEDLVRQTLFQRLADHLPEECQKMLRVQYRMIRPIGDMISSVFYDGLLRSEKGDGVPGYSNLGKEVLWIDTSGIGAIRFEDASVGSDRSVVNRAEARQCIDRLVKIDQAIDRGFVLWAEDRKPHVLLIAPYRHQVEELQRQLSRTALARIEAEVLSVDSVQGREADFVIFSVTRSNPDGRIGFLGEAHWRRINVALSRAKFGLTVVGDAAFCAAIPGGLRDVIDYIHNHPDDCEIVGASR